MRVLDFKPSILLQRSLRAPTPAATAAVSVLSACARSSYFERLYGHQPRVPLQTYARNTHITGSQLSGYAHWWATNPITSTTLNFTSLTWYSYANSSLQDYTGGGPGQLKPRDSSGRA